MIFEAMMVRQWFDHDPLATISDEETISSKFSSNSEAYASELLENLEEMLSRDVCGRFFNYTVVCYDNNIYAYSSISKTVQLTF